MDTVVSYLLANTYSGVSPLLTAAASCKVNGQEVACPQFLTILGPVMIVTLCIVAVVTITGMWKVFTKAGQPGWACIIPIYSLVVMLRIVRKPVWWVILGFIPLVNAILGFVIAHELAKSFGKGFGFTLGLIFLPFIFYPILGFGEAVYGSGAPTPMPQPIPQNPAVS